MEQGKEAEKVERIDNVHIFAWPFRLNKNKPKNKKADDEWKDIGWERKNLSVFNTDKITWGKEEERRKTQELFMINQYFSYSARKIFINEEDSFCRIYEYSGINEKNWFYYIKAAVNKNKENKVYEYKLPIASIELHLYEQGMGILFIQVKNSEYKEIEDVRRINGYGRRTMLPFLPDKESDTTLCAEELKIIYKNNEKEKVLHHVDFRKKATQSFESTKQLEELLKPADFLFDILNGNLNKKKTKKLITVIPIKDDRMFTISLVRNDKLSKKIESPKWDKKLKEQMYKLIYIDPDDLTCQDTVMREEMLNRAVYPRWHEYGTIYGATAYSMLCITSEYQGINASVARPFLAEYKYFVSLVLAQWMGINIFADKLVENSKPRKFVKLQEDYIKFKNNLLILEISNQEQGIEIYDLLQKQMMIEEEKRILDEQLNSVYEVINVKNNKVLQILGIGIAILALGVSVITVSVIPVSETIGEIIRWFNKIK